MQDSTNTKANNTGLQQHNLSTFTIEQTICVCVYMVCIALINTEVLCASPTEWFVSVSSCGTCCVAEHESLAYALTMPVLSD